MASPGGKPKIGLLTFASEWFWEVGSQKSYPELPKTIENDALKIVSILKKEADVIHPGVIGTKEKVLSAIDEFRKESVDLLIICPLMWTDDEPLFAAIEQLSGIPLLIWCYTPELSLPEKVSMPELLRRSGPVAVLQFSGPLKKMNKRFEFIIGTPDDSETITEIIEWAKAARLVKELKESVIGILPYSCGLMSGTHTDEFRLRTEIGPQLRHISVGEYKNIVEKVTDSELESYLGKIAKNYDVVNVSDKSLKQSARVSLGLAKLVNDYALDALAIEDLNAELHRELGVRPSLSVDSLFDRAVVSMEADVSAAAGLLILKQLTGNNPMYTELLTYDLSENTVLAGHPGIHDIRLASENCRVTIVPDYEYAGNAELEGAWMEFTGKPGTVTLVSLTDQKDCFQMIAATGESLPVENKLEGYPHMYIKLHSSLPDFYTVSVNSGITQHWSIVPGNHLGKLEKFSRLLGIKQITI